MWLAGKNPDRQGILLVQTSWHEVDLIYYKYWDAHGRYRVRDLGKHKGSLSCCK